MEKIKTIKANQGFTLIELLVVISIIALLSVIVLAAVNDARDRAKNTKRSEIAMQYFNALNLVRSDLGDYPSISTSKCLGYDPDISGDTCYYSWTGDKNINDLIERYYPDLPKDEEFLVPVATTEAKGIIYKCTSSSCTIFWYLKGDSNCPMGAIKSPNEPTQYTRCDINLKEY